MQILLLLFIVMPIIEISVLLQVGDMIGGWNTLGLIIITAFVGAYLVRREGLSTLAKAQHKMAQRQVPGKEMLEGMLLLIAGVMLVTPGFVTDFIGLAFTLPFSRKIIANAAVKHLNIRMVSTAHSANAYQTDNPSRSQEEVINGEYSVKPDNDDKHRLQ